MDTRSFAVVIGGGSRRRAPRHSRPSVGGADRGGAQAAAGRLVADLVAERDPGAAAAILPAVDPGRFRR
jgi:hypothetical protein